MQECDDVIPAFLLHGEDFKIPCVIKTDWYDAHCILRSKKIFTEVTADRHQSKCYYEIMEVQVSYPVDISLNDIYYILL